MVEKKLGVPRSTLSGWFKDIVLTADQRKDLSRNWKIALGKARIEAVKWHNTQKQLRLRQAQDSALGTLNTLDISQNNILELSLAMLYLGEGLKASSTTSLGSSSPLILKFFVKSLYSVYNIDPSKIRCDLHLRADQDGVKMKQYWSKELRIPLSNFISVVFDSRTKGAKTYEDYKGVCVVRCGNAAIQRKLICLSQEFCKKIIAL